MAIYKRKVLAFLDCSIRSNIDKALTRNFSIKEYYFSDRNLFFKNQNFPFILLIYILYLFIIYHRYCT